MARRLASLVVCGLVLLPHTSASPCPNTPPGAVCCGDGTVQGDGTGNSGELCDQGQVLNQQPATGCTAGCVTDPFWYCAGSPSTCRLSSRYQVTGTGQLRMLSGGATLVGFQNLFSTAISQLAGLKNPSFNVINPVNGISQFNFDLAEVNAALIPDLTTQLQTLAASRGMAVTFNHNCGNGLVELGELCDDALRNHGCSPTCTPDSLNTCYGNLVSEQVQNPPRTLQRQVCTLCGNGQKNGNEQCDDGNVNNNDGCTAHCLVQSGWSCVGFPSVCTLAGVVLPVVAPQLCGNGQRNSLEQCDDGNNINFDGCTSLCTVEAGWTCNPIIAGGPDVCRRVVVPVVVPLPVLPSNVCGDGIRSAIESCDDRNLLVGDGCTSLCTIEPGFTCVGAVGFLSSCTRLAVPQVQAIGFDTDDDDSFEWWYLLIPLAICLLLSCLLALLMRKPKETPPPRYIPPPPPVVKPEVPFMVHEAPAQSPAVVYEVYDTFDDPVYA